MSKSVLNKFLVTLTACSVLLALSFAAPRLSSQEKKGEGKAAADKAGDKKDDEKKERAKPKGRLPNYYADVVSGEQKEKIYSIQAKYADQIDKLEEQLKALTAKRDAEVEAVLTPEQKAKVIKAAAEAKLKKAPDATAPKDGAAGDK